MRIRVISDGVSRRGNLMNYVWALLYKFPDQEKCCLHLVFGEHIEKKKRIGIVRAVVIGQREFASMARRPDKGASVKLRTPCHRVIAGKRSCAEGRGADDE